MNIEDFLPKYPEINKSKYSILRPYSAEKHLNDILYHKKEFYENKLDEDEKFPIEKGEYTKYQKNIIRFLSSNTPYDSLLLVHEPGLGKTCSAIGSIEQVRQENSTFKGAVIFAKGEPLLDNFTKQLVERCTHGQYIPQDYKNLSYNEKVRRIKKNIKYYQLKTFVKFAKQIKDISDEIIIRNYSNKFIVIDEVHNLRIKEGESKTEELEIYIQFHRFLHLVKNCKILLMSGTPMKDSIDEIASVMNLILPLDKQLPSGNDFLNEFTINKNGNTVIREDKKDELKKLFLGKISFLKESSSSVPKEFMGSSIGKLKHLQVEPSIMSDFQTEHYKRAYSEDIGGKKGVFSNTREATLFVFPDGSYGKKGFEKYISYEESKIKNIPGKYKLDKGFKKLLEGKTDEETLKNIEKYSCSYAKVIKNILQTKGNCFIYSSVVQGSGCILFSLLLELFNFSRANGKEVEEKPRYAILTNITTNTNDIKKINNRFNQSDNKEGKYIKVIIGSKAISEGFSFNNVIFESILTPWWNYSEISQAIARGIRFGSHKDLRNPKVKILQSVSIPKDNSFSVDLYLYETSEDKDISIKSVIRLLMEISFDCALNYTRNRILGIDNSRECDYTVCQYSCDGIDMKNTELKDSEIDYSTYNIYYSNEKTINVKKKIEQLLRENIKLSFDDIYKKLKSIFTEEEIENALISIKQEYKDEINYMDFLNIYYTTFPVKNIIYQIEKLFQHHFSLNYKEIKNNFKEYNDFQILSALSEVINKSIVIRNKYGFPSYLREDHNIYYLVNNIDIQYDYLAEYYTKYPHIKEQVKIQDIFESSILQIIDNLFSSEKESKVIKILKIIPEDIQKILLESSITSNYMNIEKNKDVRNFILNFYKSYIDKVDNIWVSSFLKKKGELRCIEDGKNVNEWKDCDNEIIKIIKEKQIEKEKIRENNPYGLIGTYNEEKKKFCILDLKKEKEIDKKDKRLSYSGKVCSFWKVDELVDIIVNRLKIKVPDDFKKSETKDKLIDLVEQDENLLKILGGKDNMSNIDKDDLRRVLYYGKSKKEGGIKSINSLCRVIEQWLRNNNMLEKDEKCGVQGKTKKIEEFKEEIKIDIKLFKASKTDEEFKKITKNISSMMNECFKDNFNVEYDENIWITAFIENKLVGFLTLDKNNIIWNVCVAKKYRLKGVAKKIISETIKKVCSERKIPMLKVDKTKKTYKKLIEMYKKFGFIIDNDMDDEYTTMKYICK